MKCHFLTLMDTLCIISPVLSAAWHAFKHFNMVILWIDIILKVLGVTISMMRFPQNNLKQKNQNILISSCPSEAILKSPSGFLMVQ